MEGKTNSTYFDIDSIFPKFVINSKGEREPFDISDIKRKLAIETGLDSESAQKINDRVIRKILGEKRDDIKSSEIKDLVCAELSSMGLDKHKALFGEEKHRFWLDNKFIEQFKHKQPEWGPIGYITYKRTYSRVKKDGGKEEFWETVKRVVEGCYSSQKTHCVKLGLPWDEEKEQKSAQTMFKKIWEFKFLPPGRGLWIMGTEFTYRHGSMALNNCGFVSTNDIDVKNTKPFEFVMDALMLGVGVGFDTKGAGKMMIKEPKGTFVFQVPDNREGWVEGLKYMLNAFFEGGPLPSYDFSLVRPKGSPIRGFGGIASGPGPLTNMYEDVKNILANRIGRGITSVDIVDIMNLIGRCVVAGNVRRSAEIAIGDPNDHDYVTMKDFDLYAVECRDRRWASNNSVFVDPHEGFDYSELAKSIVKNGEPGIVWLKNSRDYSRMSREPDYKDKDVMGVNPCFAGHECLWTSDDYKSFEELDGKQVEVMTPYGFVDGKVWSTGIRTTITLTFDDGSTLTLTPDHKLKTSERKSIRAEDTLGKTLLSMVRNKKVVNITSGKKQKVYDFSAPDVHWGFVNGIVAANCGEQSLESFELCCLSELFPSRHNSYEEFEDTLKYAYLYGKSVTLVNTHWKETNAIMLKNRRIGTSLSGIIDTIVKIGRREFLNWCDKGYKFLEGLDVKYSSRFCVPQSIKRTTVKPSGTVSLLPGVSPGIHYPHSKYYIRRMRIANDSALIPMLKGAGYHMEPIETGEQTMMVVEFPIKENNFERGKFDVTMWEQIQNAIDFQKYWSDNQVSITVSFKKEEAPQIKYALEVAEDKLKSISFLPLLEHGYKQAPYEEITEEKYNELTSKLKPIDFDGYSERASGVSHCDSDRCDI